MALPHKGSWGLPDFGFTEKIGDLFGKSRTAQGGSNLIGSSRASTPTPNKSIAIASPAPTGGSRTGGTAPVGGGGTAPSGGGGGGEQYNIDDDANRRKAEEEARRQQLIAEERKAINEEFAPIFSALDARIGRLPGERVEYEKNIGDLATSQQANVTEQEKVGLAKLDKNITDEQTTAKKGFRELEEDVRNNLLAQGLYLGALGAGDSSATGRVSEAITKGALKARGGIIEVRNQAISAIKLKQSEVESLARQEANKINQWKSSKLLETTQFFSNKLDELENAKANASSEKARAIANVIRGLNSQFVSRLQQIDDQVSNFKQSVSMWQMQRQAELEDYATKLSMSSAYSSTSGGSLKDTLNNFSKIYGTGALNLSDSAALTGLDLTGLQLTDTDLNKKKEPFIDTLSEAVSGRLQDQNVSFMDRIFGS